MSAPPDQRRAAVPPASLTSPDFSAVFALCAHGIAVSDARTDSVVSCNPAFARMLGRSCADVTGRPVFDLYAPAMRDQIRTWIQAAHRDGEVLFEAEMLRTDNSTFPVEVGLVAVREADGTVSHRVASIKDLSLRRRAEVANRSNQRKFSAVFHSSGTAICVTGLADGRLEEVNEAFLAMFGYSREEVVGRSTIELRLWADPGQREHLLANLRANRRVSAVEMQYRKRSGEPGYLLLSAEQVETEGRWVILAMLTDITARKETEQFLQLQRNLALGLSRTASVLEGLALCLNAALSATGLDAGGFYLFNDAGALELVVHEGLSEGFVGSARHYPAGSEQARIVTRGIPVYTTFGQLGLPVLPAISAEGLRFFATIPFRADLQVIGCLNVASHTRDTINAQARQALETIAVDATQAIARLRIEEALRRERTRLNSVIEGTGAAVWEWNVQTGETIFNARWSRMLGYEPSELAPTTVETWRRLMHPDDLVRATGLLNRHFAGEPVDFDLECRLRHKDGHWVWVLDRGRLVSRTPTGAPLLMLGTHADITATKEAALALEESERNYREIFNATDEAIFVHDAETGRVLDVNAAMLRMYGFSSREEYLAATPTATFVDDPNYGMPAALRQLQRAVTDGPQVFSWRARRRDGNPLWAEISLRSARITGKNCILAVVRDTTARKAAEDALRESEEKFLKAFHRAPNLVSITRLSDGAFVDVNDRFLEVSGYRRDELIGRRSPEIGWVDSAARTRITNMVRTHGVVENWEISAQAKDGRRVDLLYAGEIVLIGGERCLLSNAVDITQRKRTESIEHARLRLLEFSGKHTLEELLVATLDEAEALTGAQVGFYHFLHADQQTLSLQAWSTRTTRDMCHAEGKGQHYNVDKAGVWVDCIRLRTPVVHNDYAALPHRKGLPAGHAPVIREMVVPVFRNNLIVALLGVGNKPTLFTDEDVQAVFKLADLAWDIAEHKRAESTLWENQQRYRQLVESSFDWVWEVDTAGRYTFASPRVRDLLGYEPADILGKTVFALMAPAESERIATIFAELAAARKPIVALENTCLHRDGRPVIVETNGVPIFTSDGKWSGYRGMDRDVTARRTAERRLRLHGAALEAAADAILITNRDGRIEWANRAFTELSGWTLDESIGRKPGELVNSGKHDEDFFRTMWSTILAGRVWRGEIENRRKDGAHRTELMNITPLMDERGGITHFIAIKQDITRLKAVEAASRQAQRMEAIGTLASGIAHDLNNILSPITMVSGLLRAKLPDEADQEILAMIHQNAMRGANIIRQLLTFSRGVEGQRLPVPIRHLLREIMALMRETFPREINLHLECPNNLSAVLADPTQIHQVVLNLCVNARDAMPDGGHLSLRAANETLAANDARLPAESAPGSFVMVEVKDTGHGVPPEIQHRVFDPFFTTKPIGKGTGLGLSTVLGIVRSHGGFITLDSTPELGATFRVYLPAVQADAEAPAVRTPWLGSPGQGRVVLVVEDERNIRETLRLFLERTGYRVLLAVNGKDALAQFNERPESISLIITDVMMPVMSGVALVRALRESGADVPVIVSSGLKDVSAAEELAALGVPEILTKPYEQHALLEAIDRKLRQTP